MQNGARILFSLNLLPRFCPAFFSNSRKHRQHSKKAILLLNEAQTHLLRAFFDKTSVWEMVGLGGLEPPTSPLSGVRSNQAELQTQSCLFKQKI